MVERYKREKAVNYAHKWAYTRNPEYYNFDSVGGDCTSFVSQCIYAGSEIMNYKTDTGWYYINGNRKSPSWSGVEYLHKFLTTNKGVGPFGKEVDASRVEIGDISQLSFDGKTFSHSQLIVNTDKTGQTNGILVATHTFDSDNRRISTYKYEKIRFIHIEGIRK